MNDREAMFMQKTEGEALAARITALERTANRTEGKSSGITNAWVVLVGAIGAIGGIGALIGIVYGLR